jgi:uncharacterized protein (DUF2141 family)
MLDLEQSKMSKPLLSAQAVIVLCCSLVCSSLPVRATERDASTLIIRIENVSSTGGLVRVALYDRATYAGHDQKPLLATEAEARAPETIVKLSGVPFGIYAVKMFQDVYRTGTFVTSKLGLPEEPFGFSNDALPLFDQPNFDSVKFRIASGSNEIVVHLRSGL